ncbi:MAG: stage 0 sporulation protein, partial [Kiritimatiellae bacterium]|nr:stage 0 sporulation protein [Kiritimatiellia bacterium]
GGLGACGRPICCGAFLNDFQPVSIRMAKDQNIALDPDNLNGFCQQIKCCVAFEHGCPEATCEHVIAKKGVRPLPSGVRRFRTIKIKDDESV